MPGLGSDALPKELAEVLHYFIPEFIPEFMPELPRETNAQLHSENRGWYVNPSGQTMVVFPNPSGFGDSRINHGFAISSQPLA